MRFENCYLVFRYGNGCRRFTRYRIAQRASVEPRKAHAETGQASPEHTVEYFVGIGTSEDYIHTGMAAFEPFDRYFETFASCRRAFLLVFQSAEGIDASGATYAKFVFVFGVEIQKYAPFEHFGLHEIGSRHSRFLIYGDQDFQRGMLHVVGCYNGKRRTYAYSVVRSQSSSVSLDPFSVDITSYAFRIEIEIRISVFLVYHVHMTLKYHYRRIFHAFSGRFAEYDIANLVHRSIEVVLFTEFFEEFYHFGFFFRTARCGVKVFEIIPYDLRFQRTYVFTHN